MAQIPKLAKVDALIYKCTVCPNFKVVINHNKKLNPGQVQAEIAKQEAKHLKECHSREDVNQAAARVVHKLTDNK